jgi:glycosyltransferase involved in cell wall biosynthesis
MRQTSLAPGALIPPPIPDPLADPQRLDPDETARAFGLESDHFFLYSGNLDPYQELGVLGEAARQLSSKPVRDPAQLVIATHDSRAERVAGEMPGVAVRRVGSSAEMQALIGAARATLLMRTAEGGFPIKLVNALSLGTPAIAFRGREWGLEDGVNASIASLDAPAASLAAAIERLQRDDELAARLRAGARALYLARHRPEDAARHTLELIEEVIRRPGRGPDAGAGDRAMLPAA